MPTWTIYCHIHKDTQRRYIGLTKQTMKQRWKNHVHAAMSAKGKRPYFSNAIPPCESCENFEDEVGCHRFGHEEWKAMKARCQGQSVVAYTLEEWEGVGGTGGVKAWATSVGQVDDFVVLSRGVYRQFIDTAQESEHEA